MISRRQSTLIHFATGGLGHFFRMLGHSILFAEKTGRTVSVVSEYHQPLAKLPLSQIFELAGPLVPLESISPKERLRAMTYRPQWRQGMPYILRSLDGKRSYDGRLPTEVNWSHRFRLRPTYTTGDWFLDPEMATRPTVGNSMLASVASLSLRGEFVQTVRERASFLNEPYLAIHFRNTDISSDLESVLRQAKTLASDKGLKNVYWCTDDSSSIPKAQKELKGLQLLHNQPHQNQNLKNLHYGLKAEDSLEHLKNTFADLWTLAASSEVVTTVGGWKKLIPILRDPEIARGFFGVQPPKDIRLGE